jgi:dolichyl-phosphate beta-glucosyltransferase
MATAIQLTVVVPAYNEEERLPATLTRVVDYLRERTSDLPAEVLVVDDGSRDDTSVVGARVATPPGVTITSLTFAVNEGKGAAVRAGMQASRGAWVLISDADLATPIEELAKLESAGVDLAIGSRAVDRSLIARRQPIARDTMGRIFNVILRLLGLTVFSDTQCGFKLLRGTLARRLAAEMRLDGFAFDVELLARAARHGATLAEVPVRWYHVDASRVRPIRHSAQMLRDVLRLRLWLWLGR